MSMKGLWVKDEGTGTYLIQPPFTIDKRISTGRKYNSIIESLPREAWEVIWGFSAAIHYNLRTDCVEVKRRIYIDSEVSTLIANLQSQTADLLTARLEMEDYYDGYGNGNAYFIYGWCPINKEQSEELKRLILQFEESSS